MIILLFLIQISFSQSLDFNFEKICNGNNIVGGSLIVSTEDYDEIVHCGFSNLKNKTLINDNTLFKVASISKIITTIGVLKLYEKGLLDLDSNINDYLDFEITNPNFIDKPITVEMLLNHTSSLSDLNKFNATTLSDLFKKNKTEKNFIKKSPGSFFSYANINFIILGAIIENVSQQRFDNFIEESIFKPLNINSSFNLEKINYDNLSVLYRHGVPQIDIYYKQPTINLQPYTLGQNTYILSPHSGCRISAIDLLKLVKIFLNSGKYYDGENEVKLLNENTVKLILNPTWEFDGKNGDNFSNLFNKWGLGLHILRGKKCDDIIFEDKVLYGHIGFAYGFLGSIYFNVEENQSVLLLLNGYKNQKYKTGEKSAFYKVQEEVFYHANNFLNSNYHKKINVLNLEFDKIKKKSMFYFKNDYGYYFKKVLF